MSETELLRLLFVPALGYAAYRDWRTRRIPRRLWYPLVALAVLLLAWDLVTFGDDPAAQRLLLLRVGLSVGLLVPLGYAFHRLFGFGLADAKAIAVIAVAFPAYPTFAVGDLTLPLIRPSIGVFSLSILADAALLGMLYPVALAVRNAAAGQFGPAMVLGRPVSWRALPTTHGKLLEREAGVDLDGLDLDALRMYLRWRGIDLADVRERAEELRHPNTLPDDPEPPTDGAVAGEIEPLNDVPAALLPGAEYDDPWGAMAFLESIDGTAYGTTPETLRAGLDLVATRDSVWVMPGLPFLVPLAVGLVVALLAGDLMIGFLALVGLA